EFTLPPFRKTPWDGGSLAGKTILLHTEQGNGDTLQFIRYAPLVKARGGRVLLACPKGMVPLLSTCKGLDGVVAKGEPLPSFDVHAPLLSLPRLFGTTVRTVPADIPYLATDARLVEHWRRELGAEPGFKIGVVWQGSPKYREDRARSIPLSHFEPFARIPDVRLFSLQKGPGIEQLAAVANRLAIVDLGSRLD